MRCTALGALALLPRDCRAVTRPGGADGSAPGGASAATAAVAAPADAAGVGGAVRLAATAVTCCMRPGGSTSARAPGCAGGSPAVTVLGGADRTAAEGPSRRCRAVVAADCMSAGDGGTLGGGGSQSLGSGGAAATSGWSSAAGASPSAAADSPPIASARFSMSCCLWCVSSAAATAGVEGGAAAGADGAVRLAATAVTCCVGLGGSTSARVPGGDGSSPAATVLGGPNCTLAKGPYGANIATAKGPSRACGAQASSCVSTQDGGTLGGRE
jgi:hypothetical protein